MKKFLSLLLLFSLFVSSTRFSAAQSKSPLTKTQKKDVAKLVEEIKAKLPVGWKVEYRAKGTEGLAYDLIEVTRLEKTALDTAYYGPNANPSERLKFSDRVYEVDFEITPFLSNKEYAQTILRNENIEKQLGEMYRELIGMGMSHKYDSFLPKTPEQEAKVYQYKKLKRQLVSMPEYHFKNISLREWIFELDHYKRVRDKAIRRECALVSESIDSLLTPYTGKRFKIDEERLSREYAEPEPPIIEKEGEVPGS